MTVKFGDGGNFKTINPKLVGSYTLTPTKWTSDLISITSDIFTIVGHTLVIGDQVMFTYQKNRANTSVPVPLIPGKLYYVRAVSGNTFKVATANDDVTLVTGIGAGTAGTWRVEKSTGIGSITISSLNLNNARVVLKNGGYMSGFPSLNFRINTVADADGYYYVQNSASGLDTYFYFHHAGSNNPIRLFSMFDFFANNSMVVAKGIIGWEGSSSSSQTPAMSGSPASFAGGTKVDSRFNMITDITVLTGGVFNGDFTMEVYEL